MSAFLSSLICLIFFFGLFTLILMGSAIKKIPDNEQWVVTRLGETLLKRPGWMLQIPLIDRVVRVNMAEWPINVQDQTCLTSDRVPAILHMLVYCRVADPLKYAAQAGHVRPDLAHLASGALKEMVSARPLDQILAGRDELGEAICAKLNQELDPAQGLRVDAVKLMEIVVSKEILAALPAAPELPSECPACGAPLDAPAGKGLRPYKCAYCGFLIKV